VTGIDEGKEENTGGGMVQSTLQDAPRLGSRDIGGRSGGAQKTLRLSSTTLEAIKCKKGKLKTGGRVKRGTVRQKEISRPGDKGLTLGRRKAKASPRARSSVRG